MLDGKERHPARLLVLCQLFYPELVSTGQTLTELCEELAGRGMEIEVICGPPTVLRQEKGTVGTSWHKGIKIRRVWGTRFPKSNLIGWAINQMTFAVSVFFFLLFDFSKRPVLVLTNPPFLAFTCAILTSLGLGKRYIYLVFDVYPDSAVKLGLIKGNGLVCRIWNAFNRLVLKHAAAVVVIGRCMRNVIAEKAKDSLPNIEEKIHHIHVWSDDNLIRSIGDGDNPFVGKWGLHGKFVVGYSGNIGRFHDMQTIMDAICLLQEYKDMEFVLVGEGDRKGFVETYVAEKNLSNCQVHTYVAREDLGFSLSSADIGLVSLGEGHEGLSVPSKTYGIMAAGVPVVAVMSSSSEIAMMIQEEKCGVVVKPGDSEGLAAAILSLYNDRKRLSLMAANARLAIENKYNLNAAAEAYCDLLAELTN